MSNTSLKDSIYYVYKHVDPRDDELLYIGHGCRARAWTHGSDKSPLRSQEHLAHLEDMILDGFLPPDWVHMVITNVTKSEACFWEQDYIRTFHPKYNKPQGKHLLKLTLEDFISCQEMREDGMSYNSIAEEMGVSAMTIYRALNGQTKNIGEDYAA